MSSLGVDFTRPEGFREWADNDEQLTVALPHPVTGADVATISLRWLPASEPLDETAATVVAFARLAADEMEVIDMAATEDGVCGAPTIDYVLSSVHGAGSATTHLWLAALPDRHLLVVAACPTEDYGLLGGLFDAVAATIKVARSEASTP